MIKMDTCSASLRTVSERIVNKSYYLPTNTVPDMECDWRGNIKKGCGEVKGKKKKKLDKL